jgi:DNA replication and repair protein RecF
MRSAIVDISLGDFRSYETARLETGGASVFLFGPNGAGKTNLLEAASLFSPGRGLRAAALADMGRRLPGEAGGRTWGVSAGVRLGEEMRRIGTGTEAPGATRRVVRIDEAPAAPSDLAALMRPLWLTPAQDRLFLDAPGERRRFFDRLTLAAEPTHAGASSTYERALRERMRLLAEPGADPAWLAALETRLGEAGAQIAMARARTLGALQEEIAARPDAPFPRARLQLSGPYERAAADGAGAETLAARLCEDMARSRGRDAAAGRALSGPHRTDLVVIDADKDRPAAECSTGEQKALVLNLVLAQAARLSRAESFPNPILLLDEVAAHLDPARRAALFDEIEALSLQAFLTGTDETLFETLRGRALGVRVDASRLAVMN